MEKWVTLVDGIYDSRTNKSYYQVTVSRNNGTLHSRCPHKHKDVLGANRCGFEKVQELLGIIRDEPVYGSVEEGSAQ